MGPKIFDLYNMIILSMIMLKREKICAIRSMEVPPRLIFNEV